MFDRMDFTVINMLFPLPTWQLIVRFSSATTPAELKNILMLLRWFGAIKDFWTMSNLFAPTKPHLLTSSLLDVSSLRARPVVNNSEKVVSSLLALEL